jgi:hypothetical protein
MPPFPLELKAGFYVTSCGKEFLKNYCGAGRSIEEKASAVCYYRR